MPNTTCKNCSHATEDNFCSNCGQATHIHRIDASYFLHDIPHSILHVDKGFPYTFLQLVKRPSKALEEYIEGKRMNFFRPFAYVILMSAISSLITSNIQSLIKHMSALKTGEAIIAEPSFFLKYQSVFIFLMIPVVSLCTWLVFKKCRYNFWEHVLTNTYLAAQLNVLLILIQLFSLIKFIATGSANYSLIIFMTGFMTYYSLTFSGLMFTEMVGWKLGLKLSLMCFLLPSLYATSMIFAGVAK